MVVVGGNSAGEFLRLLKNGSEFGLKNLNYAYQEGSGGIAAALALTEHFVDKDKVVVILGDNIIEENIKEDVEKFEEQKEGARIILKHVPDPSRFGVAIIEDFKVTKIEEKPKNPKSPYAVIGIYMYDSTVFEFIKTLKPSSRGEMEITDVNNYYLRKGKLKHSILEGWWSDAGTFDSLLKVSNLIVKTGANKI